MRYFPSSLLMLMIEKTPHSLPYLGYVKLELSFQMKEKGKIEHYA